jgi:hypothetical protein
MRELEKGTCDDHFINDGLGGKECKFRLTALDEDEQCERCTKVKKPGPMDAMFSEWLWQINRADYGITQDIDRLTLLDEEGIKAVAVARSIVREEKRKVKPDG